MSDYTYASYTTYMPPLFGTGTTWERQIYNGHGGVIADPVNGLVERLWDNDTFETSEVVKIVTSAPGETPETSATLSYEGTVEINGTLHPVFEDALGNIYVFSQEEVRLPYNLDINTINDNDPYAFPQCFARGTLISTPAGARRIEDLAIGDLIVTADGRAVPVLWVARQSVFTAFAVQGRLPVRIARGALGGGLPHRDLVVTADHGMILDGMVINASALVGLRGIAVPGRAEMPAQISYYHLETEAHEAILAEGAASESFVNYQGRAVFDNHAEYLARYGAERVFREMDLPRVTSARMLPGAIAARIGVPGLRNAA